MPLNLYDPHYQAAKNRLEAENKKLKLQRQMLYSGNSYSYASKPQSVVSTQIQNVGPQSREQAGNAEDNRRPNTSERQYTERWHDGSERQTNSERQRSSQKRQKTNVKNADSLLQLIQIIEEKALHQIEYLKKDRIELLRQLKGRKGQFNHLQSQHQNYPTQFSDKNKNYRTMTYSQRQKQNQQENLYQNRNRILKSSTEQPITNYQKLRPEHINTFGAIDESKGQENGYYKTSLDSEKQNLISRIIVYQNELRRKDQAIGSLQDKLRLGGQERWHQGDLHLRDLYKQGQEIRRDTKSILMMKESRVGSDETMKMQKEIQFLNEERRRHTRQLQQYKKKLTALEEENQALKNKNKRQQQSKVSTYTPIGRVANISKDNSLQKYDETVAEMRRVLNL